MLDDHGRISQLISLVATSVVLLWPDTKVARLPAQVLSQSVMSFTLLALLGTPGDDNTFPLQSTRLLFEWQNCHFCLFQLASTHAYTSTVW